MTRQIENYINHIGKVISDSKFTKTHGAWIKYVFCLPAFAAGVFLFGHIIMGLPFIALLLHCIESGYGVVRTLIVMLSVYSITLLILFLYCYASDVSNENWDKVMTVNILAYPVIFIFIARGIW